MFRKRHCFPRSRYEHVCSLSRCFGGSADILLFKAYWQRAIASRPTTAVKAYILGGIAWFAIPFGFATTLGLAAVALTDNPRFPTYPNAPTSSEISAGLSAAYSAQALLGKGGAVALLIVLFMAVTSCLSSELIAVSSLLTFDVYQRYIKPTASPSDLIAMSHMMIGVFGLTAAVFACIWNAAGIDLGWLFLVMGLLIGGAVFPAAFAITWHNQSKAGAIAGAVVGLCAGIIAWLTTAYQYFGEITVTTTGTEYATLAGNLAAIMSGLIVTVVVSMIKPQNFDWEITRAINAASAEPVIPSAAEVDPREQETGEVDVKAPGQDDEKEKEKESDIVDSTPSTPPKDRLPTVQDEDIEMAEDEKLEEEPAKLRGAFKLACIAAFLLTFIMDFLVIVPHGPHIFRIANDVVRFPCPCSSAIMSSPRVSSQLGLSSRFFGCLSVRQFR